VRLHSVVNNPMLAEAFQVQRSQGGYYGAGGWSDNYTTLNYFGIVSIADAKTVDALPEADRIHGAIVINSELPLYVTRLSAGDGGPATSDIIVYQGDSAPWGKYRVVNEGKYKSRGFWHTIAVWMTGA
jgi:hypothetical protein